MGSEKMKEVLKDLKKVVENHTEYLHIVKGETIEQLLTANVMLMTTDGKEWLKDVKELIGTLSRQTKGKVPPYVFKSLLTVCYNNSLYNVQTYAELLQIIKVKVEYDRLQN
jgi:GH24 family phage-related lysozyme (muramidase)